MAGNQQFDRLDDIRAIWKKKFREGRNFIRYREEKERGMKVLPFSSLYLILKKDIIRLKCYSFDR